MTNYEKYNDGQLYSYITKPYKSEECGTWLYDGQLYSYTKPYKSENRGTWLYDERLYSYITKPYKSEDRGTWLYDSSGL